MTTVSGSQSFIENFVFTFNECFYSVNSWPDDLHKDSRFPRVVRLLKFYNYQKDWYEIALKLFLVAICVCLFRFVWLKTHDIRSDKNFLRSRWTNLNKFVAKTTRLNFGWTVPPFFAQSHANILCRSFYVQVIKCCKLASFTKYFYQPPSLHMITRIDRKTNYCIYDEMYQRHEYHECLASRSVSTRFNSLTRRAILLSNIYQPICFNFTTFSQQKSLNILTVSTTI